MALDFFQISLCYDKSEARDTPLSETEKQERMQKEKELSIGINSDIIIHWSKKSGS